MASVPPPELLRSAWFPWILHFYWRAVPLFFQVPGLELTSWFRTAADNRTAGGSAESQHLFGLAWDLTASRPILPRLAAAATRQGLVAIQEGDHVHLQLFPKGALARAGVVFPR